MAYRQIAVAVIAISLAAAVQATGKAQTSLSAKSYADQVAERQIRAVFSQRLSLATNGYSLDNLVQDLTAVTGVRFLLDQRSLQEAGLQSKLPSIEVNLAGMVLQNGLDILLRDLDCTWLIKGDVVVITSRTTAEASMETRVYPVLDLVVVERATYYTDDYDSLIDIIISNVHPTSWSAVGGTGAIEPYHGGSALVVSQTRDVHDELELLLESLREVRESQGRKARLTPGRALLEKIPENTYMPAAFTAPARTASTPATSWQVPRVYSE